MSSFSNVLGVLILLAVFMLFWGLDSLWKKARARMKARVTVGTQVFAVPGDVASAGQQKEWAELTEHHTPTLTGSIDSLASSLQALLLASSSGYALCHGDPIDRLAVDDRDNSRTMISRDWGINSRDGLIRQIYSLLRFGHREDFYKEVKRWSDPVKAQRTLDRLRPDISTSVDKWEESWRCERVLNDDRGIRSVNFTSWDLLRASMLTRIGAALGFLSEEEAWDTLAIIGHALRDTYSSWEEVWESFRLTRWYWAGEDTDGEASNDLHDRNKAGFLLGPKGVWTLIPWDAPLPEPQYLLLDAIASFGYLSPMSSSEQSAAPAWEQELDRRTCARMNLSSGGKPVIQ